jgi:hypothetical protein
MLHFCGQAKFHFDQKRLTHVSDSCNHIGLASLNIAERIVYHDEGYTSSDIFRGRPKRRPIQLWVDKWSQLWTRRLGSSSL